jgi:hypothetical protein
MALGQQKSGPKKGSKNKNSGKTRRDWFKACHEFNKMSFKMSKTDFLASKMTSTEITGTRSELVSFKRYLDEYEKGTLSACDSGTKRKGKPKFPEVEKRLANYIQLRASKFTQDKLGLSWLVMKAKALEYATQVNVTTFEASNGWLGKFLVRNNLKGITLHGEAGDMDPEERERIMKKWQKEIFKPALEWLNEDNHNDSIEWQMERIYNADQTGLFYQKLPNRIYIDSESKNDFKGAKQMKDKTRVTVMVCTASNGDKVPLAIIGKSKKPLCFGQVNNKLPIAYKGQANAWFTKDITVWWLLEVFIPHHEKRYGKSSNAILLLDNCSAHKIDMNILPAWLKIVFFPPNVTNKHQPADMGMINALKVGYKTKMMTQLLEVFDQEGGYEDAARRRKATKKGCRGLKLGGKATILDAMLILDEIWKNDARYGRVDMIRRCWRKAEILPIGMNTLINKDIGRNVPNHVKVLSVEDSDELCGLMENLQVKTKSTGVNTNSVAIGLQGSFACEQKLTKEEMSSIAKNYVNIEDQHEVVNAVVDYEIEEISAVRMGGVQVEYDDDEEPEAPELSADFSAASDEDDKQKLSKIEIETLVDLLKANCAEHGGETAFDHLEKFIKVVRDNHGKKEKKQCTLHSFFMRG